MKKFVKLSLVGAVALASSASAGIVLKSDEVSSLIKGNKILSNGNITVKKAEKVSDGVTTLKIGVKYRTKQGIQERPAQAFITEVNGKQYTFLGGGYDDKGEKIALSLDTKVIEDSILWSVGTGPETLYLVTNPSCPWCEKFEKAAHDSKDFLKKYTVKVILMPFHPGATEKAYWVLSAKTEAERADRYKKVMIDKDTSWQSFKPTAEQKAALDKELAESLAGAREMEATGTPAVFDSKFQSVNWTQLVK